MAEAAGLTTAEIRARIPEWLTDAEVERLRACFADPTPDFGAFAATVRNPRNWKREIKTKDPTEFDAPGWERMFDCRPLDDQLRLYVLTDPEDREVLGVKFQGE